jgi:hypothetical protein
MLNKTNTIFFLRHLYSSERDRKKRPTKKVNNNVTANFDKYPKEASMNKDGEG